MFQNGTDANLLAGKQFFCSMFTSKLGNNVVGTIFFVGEERLLNVGPLLVEYLSVDKFQ